MELNFNSAVKEQLGCVVLLDLITSLSVARLPAHQRFFALRPRDGVEFFFLQDMSWILVLHSSMRRQEIHSPFYSVQLSAPDSGAIPSKLTFQLRRTRPRLSSPRGSNCEL